MGPFPIPWLRENPTDEVRRFFEYSGRQRFPAGSKGKESERKVKAAKRLSARTHERDVVFLDLMERMLRIDPCVAAACSLPPFFFFFF